MSEAINLNADSKYRAKLRELRRRLALVNDEAQLIEAKALGDALARLAADFLELASSAPASLPIDEFVEPVFPKCCGSCGTRFETRLNFECLPLLGYVGAFKTRGGLRCATELRRCNCSNTIALDVQLPMARLAPQEG